MKDRIRKLRKELDLTQEEFGKRIGIKRNTIASYEIGRNSPINAVIFSICREFNVDENWLKTGDGSMFNPKLDVESIYTKEIEESKKTIHERIRFLRRNILHLSQDDLSKKLNMSRGNLSNIEINRINVTERVLTDIADKCGVRKKWLLYGEGDVFESKNDSVVRDMVFDILKTYNNLDMETQKAIDRFVLKLKEDIKKEDG